MSTARLRVGIDLGCIVPGSSGGLVNLLGGTLPRLVADRPDVDFVVFCSERSREVAGPAADNCEMIELESDGFYEQFDRILSDQPLDVLFRPYPTLERLSFPIGRHVVLMVDLLHEVQPEHFEPLALENRRDAFNRSLVGAGAIVTISDYARSLIAQRYAGAASDIVVLHPSVPPEFAAAVPAAVSDEERALVPDEEFFLYPANLWPHKNHDRVLQALHLYRETSGRATGLVMTGALAGAQELCSRYTDVPACHLGFVRPALLRLLYERSLALAFFSLHEGFGIPVLEAFASGTPVICSDTTSLPEVVGDAALTCDPRDVEAMADLMREIAENGELRELLVVRGRERLARFSWQQASAHLAAAIDLVGPLERTGPSPEWQTAP